MIPVLKNPYIDPHVKDEAMEYVYVDAEADIGAFMRDPEISGRWKYELMCRIWRQHADRPAIY